MSKSFIFETETCSRCQGTGKYSFCERFRDVCFRCHGAKVTLTKRGHVAQEFYRSLCSIAAKDLKVGDRIRINGMTHGGASFAHTATVVSVGLSNSVNCSINGIKTQYWYVQTESAKYGKSGQYCFADTVFQSRNEDIKEKAKQALEYQATLTKAGTPRKRKSQTEYCANFQESIKAKP